MGRAVSWTFVVLFEILAIGLSVAGIVIAILAMMALTIAIGW